jgi:hypothetical protein
MLGLCVSRDKLEALYREAVTLVYTSYFGPDNLLGGIRVRLSGVAARVVGAEEQLECTALVFDPADRSPSRVRTKSCASANIKRELAASRAPGHYVARVCAIPDESETGAAGEDAIYTPKVKRENTGLKSTLNKQSPKKSRRQPSSKDAI